MLYALFWNHEETTLGNYAYSYQVFFLIGIIGWGESNGASLVIFYCNNATYKWINKKVVKFMFICLFARLTVAVSFPP